MSEPILKIDVAKWVASVEADPVAYQQRQAVEITLNAIAMTASLKAKMFLKGGILMGLAYNSPRQTVDIDLTTKLEVEGDIGDKIRKLLDSALTPAAASLGYADLVVKTHSVKTQSRRPLESGSFPALKLKIAYAQRGTEQENALQEGTFPSVINVDISFNELIQHTQVLELTGGQKLYAYGLADLIAEKYRAILQQVSRKRNRRQDVYDLDLLIANNEIDDALCAQIFGSFVAKCQSRHLKPMYASLGNPTIKERAGIGWRTMELELGRGPDFEGCFERVSEFYRNLPWNSK